MRPMRLLCLAPVACCAVAAACGDRTGLPVDALDSGALFSSCPNGVATLVYVLTRQNEIYSFYPPTLAFKLVGRLACPTSSVPVSMAVDRTGVAYAVFDDGHLFRVNTATAVCTATTFVPSRRSFATFGMAYVADTSDAGETLFVADNAGAGSDTLSAGLATIDTAAMALHFISPFAPGAIPFPELTGTGGVGHLFAFYLNPQGVGSHLVEVDKTTANIISDTALRVSLPNGGGAYAFAFWGGDIWIFTASTGRGPSQVTRFRPRDSTETPMGTMPSTIVGAGVSTCAPDSR